MSPIISVIITAIIVAPITWVVAVAYRKNSYESKIGSAEEKSREIIDEALKVAETKKKEALLEAKEENLKAKNELEKEVPLGRLGTSEEVADAIFYLTQNKYITAQILGVNGGII